MEEVVIIWCIYPQCRRVCVEGTNDWHYDIVKFSEVMTGQVPSRFGYCDEHTPKKAA